MTPFRIVPQALVELDEAATFYEEQRPGLGLDLHAEFLERAQLALSQPRSGSPAGMTSGGAQVRRFRLIRFARYAIVLAVIDETPTVLAFEHSSRRPDYWRGRPEKP